jgi:hypothetical protein
MRLEELVVDRDPADGYPPVPVAILELMALDAPTASRPSMPRCHGASRMVRPAPRAGTAAASSCTTVRKEELVRWTEEPKERDEMAGRGTQHAG